jgi:hypothetical protein
MFLRTVPFLLPVADVVAGVLVGIMTGLLSAFLAYQLDNLFARYRYGYDARLLDAVESDAKLTDKLASDLTESAESSLALMSRYAESIKSYELTGELLGAAGRASRATVASLEQVVAGARQQVADTNEMIAYLDNTQAVLADFFDNKR